MPIFIQERKLVHVERYSLAFRYLHDENAGFGFPCDKNGAVQFANMSEISRESYRRCRDGLQSPPVKLVGIQDESYYYWDNAVIRCNRCGAKVELYDAFASPCPKCGTEYNGCGQQLAPREQWGEETGEVF